MDPSSKLQQLLQHGYGAAITQFNLTSFLICLFFFIILLFSLQLFQRRKLNFPPSPPKLPLIGNLHQLGTLPHRSLAALSEKYGPLMLLKLGQSQTLVVSSAKMAREVMKTHDIKFCNRPQTTAPTMLLYGCQDVGFAPYGEYWRQARKICSQELLTAKRVESFQYVRDEEVASLISKIREACGGVDAASTVDLSQLLISTSNNVISRCVFGEKFEDENGESRFGYILRRVLVLLTAFCVADFFPVLRWVDDLRGFTGELKRISKTMDVFLEKMIEEHSRKMRFGGDDPSYKKDFVDVMLQVQLHHDDELDHHFTSDSIKGILMDMFIGGSDTTTTGIEWTMVELVRNPGVMKKVQEEVRRTVGKKEKIEMRNTEKMEYMKCVIKESLRLHPPAPLLGPREASEAVEMEGYHIPSKTSVFVNAWAVQRDPEIWNSPNEFIPERFVSSSVDFNGQDCEFMPFGSGRRKCPGTAFGLASIEFVLANLLYWFDWEIPEGGVMDMSEENGLTVRKKIPLHLKPIPYVV